MPKIRLLIADDSVVMRQMLSQVLGQDPEIEVAAVAANGQIALERIAHIHPDLVLLDIVMPELDGLQAVEAIRRTDKQLPIIMVSAITETGASVTLDALARGATDYWTKPKDTGGIEGAKECIRRELVPKIKALHRARQFRISVQSSARPASSRVVRPPKGSAVKIVAIGASTGGPDALAALLPNLSYRFPVPILIAQHMPPIFTSMLADRLSAKTSLRVAECVPGELLQPGHVWIAPGDQHMVVEIQKSLIRLQTHHGPAENFCRPSIDVLFRSIASVYGPSALVVLLTGMGQDGLIGSKKIREVGGQILVQDEATSVVWGIPGSVAQAGLADAIVPLPEMALEISRRTTVAYSSEPSHAILHAEHSHGQ